jgi:hypothetical protein
MLMDAAPFEHIARVRSRAVFAWLVRLVERCAGARLVYDIEHFWHARPDLIDVFETLETLKTRRLIHDVRRFAGLPDEPRLKAWIVRSVEHTTLGVDVLDDRAALMDAIQQLQTPERFDNVILPLRRIARRRDAKREAVLSALLTRIARDAYARARAEPMALNQIEWMSVRMLRTPLDILLRRCSQHRLECRLVQLVTEAPAYAVCVVVRDLTGHEPITTGGLYAGQSPAYAAERALLNALRARLAVRTQSFTPSEGELTSADELVVRKTALEIATAAWHNEQEQDYTRRLSTWLGTHRFTAMMDHMSGAQHSTARFKAIGCR